MSNVALATNPRRSGLGSVAALIVLEAALVTCWSGGFIGVRFAIDHAPLSLILLWRSLVSGLLLLPFALAIGPAMQSRDLLWQIAYGVLAMAIYLAAYALAITHGVPTGLVALITDMLPLAVAILSWPVLGQALGARQWLGSMLGFGGVLIATGWAIRVSGAPIWAYGLPLLGTLSLAIATLLQKRNARTAMPVHQALCIQCLAASAVFAIFAWRDGSVVPIFEPGFIVGVLWLVLVATFGGWSLYYLALRKSSAARVTTVLYLSPPVTMIWAWIMFGEALSWMMAAGLAVSIAGIVIFASGKNANPQ